MKNLKLIGFLIVFVSSFMFIQCTSDPIQGPQGTAGIDGVDGVNGVDGVDGTTSCVACHSNSHRDPVNDSYDLSGHFNQTVMYTGDALAVYANNVSASCTSCHTNEGYINYVLGRPAEKSDNPTEVSCVTCHGSHETFDFENDGPDYALRNIEGVELITGGTIDYANTSNNCAYCHQPRRTGPVADDEGNFVVTPHYGPHYGAQTTMLEGTLGILVSGTEGYPGVGSSTHRKDASCVSCHMAEPNEEDGAHTFAPTLNGCTTCHSSATDFDYNGVQTEVKDLMHELQDILVVKGILEENSYGGVDLVTGSFPINVVNGYWNWEYVEVDGSHGIHNPEYTLALLKNTIASLKEES